MSDKRCHFGAANNRHSDKYCRQNVSSIDKRVVRMLYIMKSF